MMKVQNFQMFRLVGVGRREDKVLDSGGHTQLVGGSERRRP